MRIHRLAIVLSLLLGSPWIAASGSNVASAQGLMQKEEPQQENKIQQPVKFKRVKLTFNGGETAKLKNATIESGTIRGLQFYQSTLTKQVSYDFRDIKSLMYSNTRGTKKGVAIGALVGVLTFGVALFTVPGAYYITLKRSWFMAGLIGVVAPAAGIGAGLGALTYVDWKEYPLEE